MKLAVATALASALLAVGPPANAQTPEFKVTPVAEKTVTSLPKGPLYWRVESFPDLAKARAAAGAHGLAVEAAGQGWLLTLGPQGGASVGNRKAEIGPVPVAPAAKYLLRINRAGGPPGVKTPVHTHPGSEAFYVLSGQLTQQTPHGLAKLDAGQSMNGHDPGMVMQLTSSGTVPLDQLVMFVVDAEKPFSSPASFETRP